MTHTSSRLASRACRACRAPGAARLPAALDDLQGAFASEGFLKRKSLGGRGLTAQEANIFVDWFLDMVVVGKHFSFLLVVV